MYVTKDFPRSTKVSSDELSLGLDRGLGWVSEKSTCTYQSNYIRSTHVPGCVWDEHDQYTSENTCISRSNYMTT